MDYDVVVVGAGPAGCTTAKRLAELGAEVLLVEKRAEIGVPVRCGEATSVRGIRELGIELSKKFIANETKGAYIYSPNGTKVEMLSETPNCYVLERRIFDKFLGIYAAKAGAEVRVQTQAVGLLKSNGTVKGVKLRHLGEEYEVECGCVVGADGAEGMVGRWAGLNVQTKLGEMTSSVQFEIAGTAIENPEALEFYFGSKIAPRGYAWVFPKGKDIANVGLGVRSSGAPAIEYLKRFVSSKKLQGSIVGIVAGAVPVQGPVERSVGNGVLLVGDAARQVDPLTGGGIYNSMHCATIAAEVLKEAVQRDDFSEKILLEYDKRWRARIGRVLLTSLKIKGILEKMSDENLDAVARAMQDYKFRNVDVKDVGTIISSLPPNFVEFVQSLLNKN